MVNKKVITVVFDTRSDDFDNGKQYQSLVDQVNAGMQSGELYRTIEIDQWQMYHDGEPVKGEESIHIPFYRHFYQDQGKKMFGGGFMLFEVMEDLAHYYQTADIADGLLGDIELVFTVTVIPAH